MTFRPYRKIKQLLRLTAALTRMNELTQQYAELLKKSADVQSETIKIMTRRIELFKEQVERLQGERDLAAMHSVSTEESFDEPQVRGKYLN